MSELYNEEEINFLKELDEKYFVVQIEDAKKFIDLMNSEGIPLEKGITDGGFSYEELESLVDKFLEKDLSVLFMQYKILKTLSFMSDIKTDQEKLYHFIPIKGVEKKGILVLEQVDINVGRPDRVQEINENDKEQLSNMLDALNSGELDFDDFIKLV